MLIYFPHDLFKTNTKAGKMDTISAKRFFSCNDTVSYFVLYSI